MLAEFIVYSEFLLDFKLNELFLILQFSDFSVICNVSFTIIHENCRIKNQATLNQKG